MCGGGRFGAFSAASCRQVTTAGIPAPTDRPRSMGIAAAGRSRHPGWRSGRRVTGPGGRSSADRRLPAGRRPGRPFPASPPQITAAATGCHPSCGARPAVCELSGSPRERGRTRPAAESEGGSCGRGDRRAGAVVGSYLGVPSRGGPYRAVTGRVWPRRLRGRACRDRQTAVLRGRSRVYVPLPQYPATASVRPAAG